MAEHARTTKAGSNGGWLGWIERIGNRLPDPATLFLIGTVLVMIASAVVAKSGFVVEERLPEQAATAALGQAKTRRNSMPTKPLISTRLPASFRQSFIRSMRPVVDLPGTNGMITTSLPPDSTAARSPASSVSGV